MENTNEINTIESKLTKSKEDYLKWILQIAGGLFILYYLILSILAPVKTFKTINTTYQLNDSILSAMINTNSDADSMVALNTYLQSKVKLIDYDSICLSINLTDSILNLELQGVVIHQVSIKKIKFSRLFKKLAPEIKYQYLSSPFTIIDYYSTIPKVPIVVKHAPRDTTEANQINSVPEIPKEDYVHYTLKFDKQLVLIFDQFEKPEHRHFFISLSARLGKKWRFFKKIVVAGVQFQIPDYELWMKIEIPSSDAKTIFRALPENAPMTLKL